MAPTISVLFQPRGDFRLICRERIRVPPTSILAIFTNLTAVDKDIWSTTVSVCRASIYSSPGHGSVAPQ